MPPMTRARTNESSTPISPIDMEVPVPNRVRENRSRPRSSRAEDVNLALVDTEEVDVGLDQPEQPVLVAPHEQG